MAKNIVPKSWVFRTRLAKKVPGTAIIFHCRRLLTVNRAQLKVTVLIRRPSLVIGYNLFCLGNEVVTFNRSFLFGLWDTVVAQPPHFPFFLFYFLRQIILSLQ